MGSRYTTEQVAKLFRMPPSRLRRLRRDGTLPASIVDGRRRYYSFQDLVAVRTWSDLAARGIEPRRLRRAVGQLRSTLPGITHPLRDLRVTSDGNRVVVSRPGERAFDGESGQILLEFDVGDLSEEVVARIEPGRSAGRRVEDLFLEACRREDSGDLAGAEAALVQVLDRDPAHVGAVVNVGNLRYRRGDRQGARSMYEQSIALAPDRAEGFYNLGFLLLDEGDARAALPLLHAAIERDPDFPDAYFNLAVAYEHLGQTARARELWLRCIEIDPDGAFAEDARDRLRST